MSDSGGRTARRPHGTTLVYVTVGLLVFLGLVSLGVDVGHVWLAREQLQQAADAAARYGMQGLASDWQTAQNNAIQAATDNTVDGVAVNIDSSDIALGVWDPSVHTFTVLTGSARSGANAIRVTINRTAANGNGVPLLFGSIIGKPTCDVHVVSIAAAIGGYGLIGLNGISMSGNSSISYWSANGVTSAHGSIASNGDIKLSGSTSIAGDARPGPGHAVSTSGGASVTGSTAPLTKNLSFPPGSAGNYAASNDDINASPYWHSDDNDFSLNGSAALTLPGGNYYFHDFSTGGQTTLTFTGPATIYVTGNFNMSGQTVTAANLPRNLQIIDCGSGNLTISGGSALYADVYAPQSNITLSGSGDIYGSVLGQSVNMSGTSGIHYDLSLPGGWSVSTVK